MTAVVVICSVFLVTGAVLAMYRAAQGPTMLDRTIALDVVLTALIGAAGIYIAVTRKTDVIPILVALSMVGFMGSVTIARFAAVEPEGESRIQSKREAALQEARERRRLAAEQEFERRESLEHTDTLEAVPADESEGKSYDS